MLALLTLQLEWGADENLGLDPVNRLRPVAADTTPRRVVVAPSPGPFGPPGMADTLGQPAGLGTSGSVGTPGERALALAARAATLDDLRDALAGFDGCALRDTASNLVFAEGDPDSATLIVGEAPGREEDRGGHVLAGPEGQLLDQMLGSIGLDRGSLMLAPLLPWRPPGGRPPSPGEIAICLPFLHRLVVLVKPRRIVLFGATAARAMLPHVPPRRRGPRIWVEGSIPGMAAAVPVLALPGLADMLKNPPLRRDAWAGLRLLRRAINQLPTKT